MIIHKNLINFLEKIYIENLSLKNLKEHELRKNFKNNEYYILIKFCLEYQLIIIEYHEIILTKKGIDFFKILKK